jgi:hypothetical protein
MSKLTERFLKTLEVAFFDKHLDKTFSQKTRAYKITVLMRMIINTRKLKSREE